MIKFKSIRYWIKATWRRFNNKCILCGRAPINSKGDLPYHSDSYCRSCKKMLTHAGNYGMGVVQLRK